MKKALRVLVIIAAILGLMWGIFISLGVAIFSDPETETAS